MSVQMDRQDNSYRRIFAQNRVNAIEVEPSGIIYIAPDRLGTGAHDGERRGECRKRSRKNPGPVLDTCATERNLQRIEPAGNSNGMGNAPPLRQLLLKGSNLAVEDQPATSADAIYGTEDILPDIPPLTREIVRGYLQKRVLDHGASVPATQASSFTPPPITF